MSGNVIELKTHVDQAHDAMVARLERTLADVKAGKVRALVVLVDYTDNTYQTSTITGGMPLSNVVGLLEMTKYDLLRGKDE